MTERVSLDSLGRRIARHPRSQKATDGQLAAAYAEVGNVWKVAEQFGMCGQSVHERLVKIGVDTAKNVFDEHEKQRLLRDYNLFAGRGRLHVLAAQMGRTPQFLCRQARELGLTVVGRPRADAEQFSERVSKALAKHGHPRGMLGKKHSSKTRDTISQHSFDRWHGMSREEQVAIVEKSHTSWKAGWREFGGVRKFYRSKWEANYGRYLEWLRDRGEIAAWEHEPQTFWFEAIKRGVRSYLPDFRVTELSGRVVFHEVKGWMDPKSKTKLKRMAKYHPTVEIILIEKRQYTAIKNSAGRLIEGWEWTPASISSNPTST